MQTTNTILLVRPANFGFNVQTAVSNNFQNQPNQNAEIVQQKALEEFDNFANTLRQKGINVIVIEDDLRPPKPDAIFPNNWFSTHKKENLILLYPMCTPNRRTEKRATIIDYLKSRQPMTNLIDLSSYEQQNQFLEGTGSMVLDRKNACIYACLSPRTDQIVINKVAELLGYQTCLFTALDMSGKEIYHTNVMMSLGDGFAVVCLESVTNKKEQETLKNTIEFAGLELIEISQKQVSNFAGNMLALQGSDGQILVLSQSAFNSLFPTQIQALEKYATLIPIAIPTIEQVGGGSVRCMMAELF